MGKKLRTNVKCKIGLWFLSSALPLINIYVCTKKWLWGDNSVNKQDYDSCALHFLSLPSIYKPSSVAIPLVLSKIWLGQATIVKND